MVVINLLAMLATVIIIPAIVLAWLDSYTNHGESCRVPDICGMQLDDAKEVLRKQNLDLEIVDYKYKKGAVENEVVEQRPVADALVKEGRKVMLVICQKEQDVFKCRYHLFMRVMALKFILEIVEIIFVVQEEFLHFINQKHF